MQSITVYMPAIAGLLATAAGLVHWKRHNSFFRIMFWLALLGAAAELWGGLVMEGYLSFGRGMNNIPVFNIYLFCEIWLSAWAVAVVLKKRLFYRIIFITMLALSSVWVYTIWRFGWFELALWYYLLGVIIITALLLYLIKVNLETYLLSPQLVSYLLMIFAQLIFFGVAFETLALRSMIIELGAEISRRTSMIFWIAAQARLYMFLFAFLLLRKTGQAPVPVALS